MQTQEITYCMSQFIGNIKNRYIHRDRKQTCVPEAWGMGEWGVTVKWVWASFLMDENVLELDRGHDCTIL